MSDTYSDLWSKAFREACSMDFHEKVAVYYRDPES